MSRKQRVGVLYGKPIITGDENLCTKNEIHINSLKGGGAGSAENKSIIKQFYYKIHKSSLYEENWVLDLVYEDPRIDGDEEGLGYIITYYLTYIDDRGTSSLLYKPGSTRNISGSRNYSLVFYNDYIYIIILYNNNNISDNVYNPEYPEDFKECLKLMCNMMDTSIEDIDVLEDSSYEEHMEAWNYAVEKFKEEHK